MNLKLFDTAQRVTREAISLSRIMSLDPLEVAAMSLAAVATAIEIRDGRLKPNRSDADLLKNFDRIMTVIRNPTTDVMNVGDKIDGRDTAETQATPVGHSDGDGR